MAAFIDRDLFGIGSRFFVGSASVPTVAPDRRERRRPARRGRRRARPAARGPGAHDRGREARRAGRRASRPELGPVAPQLGFAVAADRASGAIVSWVQGGPEDRRLVAGYLDRPPGFFAGYTSQRCCQGPQPRLSWQPSPNLWGPLRYIVSVDGVPLAETTETRMQLTTPLAGATHRWQVIAVDARGQMKRSRTRSLRIDTLAPLLSVRTAASSAS